ncbi:hypothetical protein PJN93_29685, partial [Mycobacterium kansasii]
ADFERPGASNEPTEADQLWDFHALTNHITRSRQKPANSDLDDTLGCSRAHKLRTDRAASLYADAVVP